MLLANFVNLPKPCDMRTFLAIALITFATFGAVADDCPLVGKWKSDAARTLADIATRDTFGGEDKNAVSQGLFGHVIHEWTCTGLRVYFDGSESAEAVSYRIHDRKAGSFIVTISGQTEIEWKIIHEGECYKVRNSGRQFYEYFCPI